MYIQSSHFAGVLKGVVATHLPSDLGIDGDFSELAVKLFPPGISVRQPRITLKKRNVIDLPEGSSIHAEELHLIFRPLQMFSGTIRVHEIRIVEGEVRLVLDPDAARKKKSKADFSWDELLQIRAEAISATDTYFHIEWMKSDTEIKFLAPSLRLSQWTGKGGLGYELEAQLQDISGWLPKGSVPKGLSIPEKIQNLKAVARVNASGLQIDSLLIDSHGLNAQIAGSVGGNLLSGKDLALDTTLALQADLAEVLDTVGKKGTRGSGQVGYTGKLRANLDSFMTTARADGALTGSSLRLHDWKVDSLKAEGSWTAAQNGGEIAITKAVISSPEIARTGAYQPGSGGKIEVGAFKLGLGSASGPISVPLSLDRAHIHWLTPMAIDDIYPLDFRISGDIAASFNPATATQGWNIQAKLAQLHALNFKLDNQKYKRVRKLARVLDIPKITLDGNVFVDSQAVKLIGINVSLPRSKFQANGKIDYKAGYDIWATGAVKLEDIGKLADNEIRGEGALKTHVHGPLPNTIVDFEADLKDAFYLDMKLGAVKGVITWDDDPSHLLFRDMQVNKRRSSFVVNGKLDLGDADLIDLKVGIPNGDIQDAIQLFEGLTSDLAWFPKTLNGPMSGSATVTGGIGLDKMVIDTKLNGIAWEYMGERAKTVSLSGGYDRGRYHLSDFRAIKRSGGVSAKISFDDGAIDWDLETSDFNVTDIDVMAKLDVPVRGKIALKSIGSGRTDKHNSLKSTSTLSLTEASVRGVPIAPSKLSIAIDGGVARANGVAMGGQGILDLSYDFNPRNPSTIRLEARQLDFSPVLLLLNPKSAQDRALAGFISGSLQMGFRSGALERGTGKVDITDYLLAKSGTQFRLVRPVSVNVTDGSFDLRELAVRGNHGTAMLSLKSKSAEIEGSVLGDLDVSILEFLSPTIGKASGAAALDFALGGSIRAPTIFGRATIEGASLMIPALEAPFENITGAIQVRQNVLSAQNIQAELSGGRVNAEGKVEIFHDRFPEISLRGNLSGNKIKVYPFQYAKVRGWLKVHGKELPYLVEGNVVVESALSTEKVLNQQRHANGLKAVKYTPAPSSQRESDYPLLKLNIDAVADGGVLVQNDLFDVELKGKVTVVNTLEVPRILGKAEVLGGRMLFKDHSFDIQSLTVNFDNPTVIAPSFNLISATEVNGVKISLFASGRPPDKMKVEVSSNPVMPESEILSLLALGMTSADTQRLRAEDRQVYERGEAASLLLHSLDFNREVENKTGFQIQIDESFDTKGGASAFQRNKDNESTAAPKIVVKKRVGNKLDLSYGSTVGIGTNTQREVNAELHLTPGVSVMGVWDNYENPGETVRRDSYGLDFKLEKRFK